MFIQTKNREKAMKLTPMILAAATASALTFGSASSVAQDRFANVEMQVQPLGGSVHMMIGAGGNIGVSAG